MLRMGRVVVRRTTRVSRVERDTPGRGARSLPPPMDDDIPKRRHVWVDASGGQKYPGLVVAWRRRGDGWQGYVAVARDASVLITGSKPRASIPWSMTAGSCHRVVDNGPQTE